MKPLLKYLAPIFLILTMTTAVAGQDNSQPQIFVVQEPLFDSQDGSIHAEVVIRDGPQSTPSDLTASDIALDIAARDVKVVPRSDLPVSVSIVIDTSRGSAIDLIRDSVLAYFRNYFAPGDQVTLYIVEASNTLSSQYREERVTSLAEAEALLVDLKAGASFFNLRPALEAALAGLQTTDLAAYEAQHALFVGSYMNRPQDAAIGKDFEQAGVPLHVVQAHRQHDQSTNVFRQMATQSGGQFAANVNGSTVLAESLQPINSLKTVFDTIANSRIAYDLRFKPERVSAIQPQEAGLTVTLPDGRSVQTRLQYNMNLLAPEVAFSDSGRFQVDLVPEISGNGTLIFDKSSLDIGLVISFPDHVTRPIREVTVTIADATGSVAPQVLKRLNPAVALDGTLNINWPLAPFQRLGSTNLTITVEATGEAGLTGSATTDARVSVAPLPTPVLTATTERLSNSSSETGSAGASLMSISLTDILLIFNLVLVLAALAVLAIVVRRRRNAAVAFEAQPARVVPAPAMRTPAPPAAPNGNGPATDLGLDQSAENEPDTFGQLIVKNGVDEIGQVQILVHKKKFLIGRAPTCDLIINQPFISPEHCLVTWQDHRLYVRDLRSKNGTYVNGERISQDTDADAPLGSEINVTKRIKLELRRADYEYVPEQDAVLGSTAHSTAMSDQLIFKRLPGLRYSNDDGPEISDDYSPL